MSLYNKYSLRGRNVRGRNLCIGDMNSKIYIYDRALTPSNDFDDVDYSESFTNERIIYALVETKSGVDSFNNVNALEAVTHLFYIRYRSDVSTQCYVKYNSKYFDITEVENINEKSRFMILRCKERGITTNKGSW